MQINPAQSALQNLLNLVDLGNPSTNPPSNPDQVTASAPTAATSGTDASVNTSVVLTGVTAEGYSGEVTIEYGRLALSTEAEEPTGNVTVSATDTAAQVLEAVATFYGFIPSEISWVANPTPILAGGSNTAQVKSAGSLVYLDGDATVNLAWTAVKTAALLHFDGVNGATTTTDSSAYAHHVTIPSGASITTAQSKFGGSSIIASSAAAATMADAPELRITGDGTIEGWFFFTTITAVQALFGKATNGSAPYAHMATNAGALAVYTDSSGITVQGTLSSSLVGTWVHIALVHQGTNWTIYVNGAVLATTSNADTFGNNAGNFIIGGWGAGSSSFEGEIDEFRISNFARYTAAFTPPTAPFTAD